MHDNVANFYISLEKREKMWYICYSSTDLHKIQRDNAECVSDVIVVKNFNFKIPRWRTTTILKTDKLQYLMMMQNGVSQVYRLSGILDF